MIRTVALLVTTSVAASVLAACGGDSAYCSAVEEHETTLQGFGTKKTDAGFRSYVKVTRQIGNVAPEDVAKQWRTITSATQGVLKAHQQVGISLEDMKDADKLAGLNEADRATIQTSYDRFNTSRTARKKVVASIRKECDITLR
jgi:hypothetical protein